MNENLKQRLKINSLLREYSELRAEIRTFELMAIASLILSVLSPSVMIVAGIFSKAYVLFFISSALSIFFVLLALALSAYITNLELRISDIENSVNDEIGESTMQWEITGGIFLGVGGDILVKKIGTYWSKVVPLGTAVGIVPFVISLWLGLDSFSKEVGLLAWSVVGAYLVIASLTITVGYRFFFKAQWQKLESRR